MEYVEINEGYLMLKTERAKKLFEEYSSSGTLWEILSVLFNDYAENGNVKSTLDDLNNKLPALNELNKLVKLSEELPLLEKLITNITENRLGGIEPKQISNPIIQDMKEVEPVSVEIKEVRKPPKTGKRGMDSLVKKMKKFK